MFPDVRINRRYVEMMRDMVSSDGRVQEKNREAVQFVKNKIDSAKWFISAIKQRRDTLMRTMQEILDFQQEYFKTGDQSKLRPMILKDIADRTGLDVSTISRVVNSKYVQTQFRDHPPEIALFGGDADRIGRGGFELRDQEHPA